mmetsp:Transcript_30838/g.80457  ORF Transcript_30838/g.80457 Transcript_30838/m.80457 type:complete len:92 (-) Transcript_30838:269-544(-)
MVMHGVAMTQPVPQPVMGMAVSQAMPMQSMQTMQVTCPAGLRPGDALTISTPAGQMQVQVPAGISEGMPFQVQVPAAQLPIVNATAVAMPM